MSTTSTTTKSGRLPPLPIFLKNFLKYFLKNELEKQKKGRGGLPPAIYTTTRMGRQPLPVLKII